MARTSGSKVYHSSGSADLLVAAVSGVLTDDGFQVPSPEAAAALTTARQLEIWCKQPESQPQLKDFSMCLTKCLLSCLGDDTMSFSRRKVKMLSSFHQFRISEEFRHSWKNFLSKSIGSEAVPTFYQYVTDLLFKSIVNEEFKIGKAKYDSDSTAQLSSNDQSALRYVAGYVCRKVCDHLEKSSLAHKNALMLTLYDFRGFDSDFHDKSENWVCELDRGGLWHVIDDVFLLFCCMEEEIRKHLSLTSSRHEGLKGEIIDCVKKNEDVLFQWCFLVTDLDDDLSVTLRDKIIELYVTIRGFAFANSCMELYKQSQKKTVQKSKATRRNVYDAQTQ